MPSRSLAATALPVGGYSDVTTRGRPEAILPSQFALDSLEFLRRFAEHELLYFHREEPHRATDEELLLLIDQGVRTWGDVRLVLAAAALALGRGAARRKWPLLLASTATDGRAELASNLGPEALGAFLEASDLSPHPGLALERVLEAKAERLRDVVLLTHPRSLAEDDVIAAGRRLGPGVRLFAVAVDAGGAVELSRIVRGAAVPVGRCRVTIPGDPEPLPGAADRAKRGAWTGNVEPVGFPFRLGATHTVDDDRFAFDYGGDWLLTATGPMGFLHAWEVNGPGMEMLPRPLIDGRPLAPVEAVIGVAGGFVVVGRRKEEWLAAHYDLNARTCTAYRLGPPPRRPEGPVPISHEWVYLRNLHSVVLRVRDDPRHAFAIDLMSVGPSACFRGPGPDDRATERARLAAFRARGVPPPRLPIVSEGFPLPPEGDALRLDGATGTIFARTEAGTWSPFVPLADGRPDLLGGRVLQARGRRLVLAVLAEDALRRRALRVFLSPSGESVGAYPVGPETGRSP